MLITAVLTRVSEEVIRELCKLSLSSCVHSSKTKLICRQLLELISELELHCAAINQFNQFNGNLAAREPDSK